MLKNLTQDQLKMFSNIKVVFENISCKEIILGSKTFRLDDFTLLRFLHARDFNFKKTKKMLQDHIKFRDEYLSSLIKLEEVQDLYETGILHNPVNVRTLRNEPVLFFNFRNFNGTTLKNPKKFFKYCLYVCEASHPGQFIDQDGISQRVVILDLKHFSFKNHWNSNAREIIKRLISFVQYHDPERLKTCFIINSPLMFRVVWNFAAILLNHKTKQKIHFIKSNEPLLEVFPREKLYKCYGGLLEDPPFLT